MLRDIHEVNLAYLFLLRRLVQQSHAGALARAGLCDRSIVLLSGLSTERLFRLARSSSVLCRLHAPGSEGCSAGELA